MRKKISRTGFIIAGAAALFVGLAGNVQAIPISMHDFSKLTKSVASPTDSLLTGSHKAISISISDLSKPIKSVASPIDFFSGSILAENVDAPRNVISLDLKQEEPLVTSSSFVQGPAPTVTVKALVASVPDGGTTGMMLGGAFCGLVFLKKAGNLIRLPNCSGI
jgi:hypothetical protein